jgi:hypothetical protein
VFTVAGHRCEEWSKQPEGVTIWQLPDNVEEEFDARWELWLDSAAEWKPFFEEVEAITTPDLREALRGLGLVTDRDLEELDRLRPEASGRSALLSGTFGSASDEITMLALGFAMGSVGSLTIPYARSGES